MANITLARTRTVGSINYKFKCEASLELTDNISQSVNQITKPFGNADTALLNNAFGLKETIQLSFILLYRTDDYTDGTGSPGTGPYSPEDQKDWIKTYLLQGTGKHFITDHNNNLFEGRFSSFTFAETGDQPVSIPVIATFNVGRVLVS
jgi:hypothetical protein